MLLDILKSFIIGICASAPMGPIAILVVQKTLSKGHKAGFMAGLGASVIDTVFAIIAVFALAYAQMILDQHENIIYVGGGVIMILIGVSMTLSNPFKKPATGELVKGSSTSKDFLQALLMGVSNPMAILVIFALFTFFGIDVQRDAWDVESTFNVAPIILSVSAGTVAYWFFLSWGLSRFRDKFNLRSILWINRVMGALVIIIGVVFVGQGLYNVLFLDKPFI